MSPSLEADSPGSRREDDTLDRYPFAERIVRIVTQRSDSASMVIAVIGEWGEGKSTVLNFVQRVLEAEGHVGPLALPFNPWQYPGEVDLFRCLLDTIADGLGRSAKAPLEQIAGAFDRYKEVLAPVATGFVGPLGSGAVRGFASLSSIKIASLRQRVEDIIQQEGRQIIVLVDDVDRLSKRQIQQLFGLVKCAANFNRVSFVLAFDEAVVAEALQEEFPGDAYLEKIVQLPLRIPRATESGMLDLALTQVGIAFDATEVTLTNNEARDIRIAFDRNIFPRISTPRIAKRLGNSLQFALGALRGDVNIVDLTLLECMRAVYPDLYEVIRRSKTILVGDERLDGLYKDYSTEEIRARVDRATKGLSPRDRRNALELFTRLLPHTSGLYSEGRGVAVPSARQRYKEARLCSPEYFDRYFLYGVSTKDISDRELDELLDLNSEGDSTQAFAQAVTERLQGWDPAVFISKLRARVEDLPDDQLMRIVDVLVENADRFPNEEGAVLFGGTPLAGVAMFIYTILERLPRNDKVRFASRVLDAPTSLRLSAECFSWFIHSAGTSESDEGVLTRADQILLGASLAVRVQEAADEGRFRFDSDYVVKLISIWTDYGDKDKLRTTGATLIKSEPSQAISLLLRYGGFRGIGGRFLPPSSYQYLTSIFDGQVIYDGILKALGDGVLRADPNHSVPMTPGEELAREFVKMHKRGETPEGDS